MPVYIVCKRLFVGISNATYFFLVKEYSMDFKTPDSGARYYFQYSFFLLDPPADKFFDMSQKQTVSPVQTVDWPETPTTGGETLKGKKLIKI